MVTSTSRYAYIACDATKCIGCQLCEYICSYTKTGEYNTYRSRIRTVRVNEILITAVACRTCEDAPCVIACTRDALTQDPETGIIHVDAERCDGCAWCIEACDFGAISINPATKMAEICDQCEDREDGPQCVIWCPKDALELTTPDQRAQKARHKLIHEEVHGPR
ncbi:MAG TPA: 4Fe-4S dicluster domain-containing protein [Anaerolineae bacterium]|nr:4Fe-4S dicluster domain-containing protein [Anaerolineae bacterium]HQK14063.1 4Fe-4S dicluster domain-containing protein [Anaerolineae bacterium]